MAVRAWAGPATSNASALINEATVQKRTRDTLPRRPVPAKPAHSNSRCSRPTTGDSSRPPTRRTASSTPGMNDDAVDRVVADGERLADVCPGSPPGGRRVRAGAPSGSAGRPPSARPCAWPCPLGASSLRSWCSSMISACAMCLRRLGGEAHHQHRADREVRGDEDVGRPSRPAQRRRYRSPVVPITTCTPAATQSRAFAERRVGLGEVDDARRRRRARRPAPCPAAGRRGRSSSMSSAPSTAAQTVWPMRPAAPATATRITCAPPRPRARPAAARRPRRKASSSGPIPAADSRSGVEQLAGQRATSSSVTASMRSTTSSTASSGRPREHGGAEPVHARRRSTPATARAGP